MTIITPKQPQHKFYPSRRSLEIHLRLLDCNRRQIGTFGELLARELLLGNGYLVETGRGCDLVAGNPHTGQVYRIEVKTSRRCKDGKWRFTLYKKSHTDHRKSDVVILMCISDVGIAIPFIIPVTELQNQRQCVICSDPFKYRGRLAAFR